MRDASILVVEDEKGWLLPELPPSLKKAGADTLLALSFSEARRQLTRFDFSAAVISYKPGSDHDFWDLMEELGSTPVLLCCSEAPPPAGWHDIRFITKPARVETIVNAVAVLLLRQLN